MLNLFEFYDNLFLSDIQCPDVGTLTIESKVILCLEILRIHLMSIFYFNIIYAIVNTDTKFASHIVWSAMGICAKKKYILFWQHYTHNFQFINN